MIAGLSREAGVALAFVGSHALAVLAARLTQSYSGRIQTGREGAQRGILEDYLYNIKTTKHLIQHRLDSAIRYIYSPWQLYLLGKTARGRFHENNRFATLSLGEMTISN